MSIGGNGRHLCPAIGCRVSVDKAYLMCDHHWGLLPWQIQVRLLRNCRPQDEPGRDSVSADYLRAGITAIKMLATSEGRHMPTTAAIAL